MFVVEQGTDPDGGLRRWAKHVKKVSMDAQELMRVSGMPAWAEVSRGI